MNPDGVPRVGVKSIKGVESEFQRGEFCFARTYLRDALGWHLTNPSELSRRKHVLSQYMEGDDDIPIYVATLAALTNDRRCWDEVIAQFEDKLPASTGYFAYGCLNQADTPPSIKEDWCHLIAFSAAKGHSQSIELLNQDSSLLSKVKSLFQTKS